MAIVPKEKSIISLFSDQESGLPARFIVPKYQRKYVWQLDRWDALFDDLSENSGHFLGTFVLLELDQSMDRNTYDYQIIDGQQRLASISLLLVSLVHRMDQIFKKYIDGNVSKKLAAEKYSRKRLKIKELLFSNYDEDDSLHPEMMKFRLELSKIDNNNIDFNYIVLSQLYEGIDLSQVKIIAPEYYKNRQLYRCYNHFQGKMNDYNSMDELFEIVDKTLSAICIAIYPGPKTNAYLIFETLNNRGQPLSISDILKNKIFAKLDDGTKNIDEIDEDWRDYIEKLGTNEEIENFFRHYYIANKCNYNKEIFKNNKRPKKIMKSNIIGIYDDLIKNDASDLWDKIKTQSDFYSSLINPKINNTISTDSLTALQQELLKLRHISAIPSYSLLLYLRNQKIDEGDLLFIVKLLVKFFIRRHISDKPRVKELDDIFIDIIEKFNRNLQENIHTPRNVIVQCLEEKAAKDEEFESALAGDIYTLNTRATKYLLAQYEETKNENLKQFKSFWDKDDENNPYWTVEHILPKGGKTSPCWNEQLNVHTNEDPEEKRKKLSQKIGNLTLSVYNSKLGRKCFDKKKELLENGLILNRYIINQSQWGETEINERTKDLIKEIVELNRMNIVPE